jgi:hypothetical protein
VEKLDKFLDYIEESEHMTADTEKEQDGNWVVNRNQTNTDYEGGDYQEPRVAIMYDGSQGHNGWYWELIDGKNVVASGDHVFKTADDAKEAAEAYINTSGETGEPGDDLGRLGEEIDWNDFWKMAKDTSGKTLKDFEKKYSNVVNRPHVKNALNAVDFKSFMKVIKKFEKVNEYGFKKQDDIPGNPGKKKKAAQKKKLAKMLKMKSPKGFGEK